MTPEKERATANKNLILKIFALSGWGTAIALFLFGLFYLNKTHLEIVAMQQENKQLKISLERARARQQFPLE